MKRIILTLLIVLGLGTGFALASSPTASATAKDEICNGIGATSGGNGCATPAGGQDINSLVKTIVNVLSWIVGVLAVIMIIISGFRYVTSGGESSKISGAKDTLIYAIVGIVIVAFSQIIVRFVLQKVG